MAELKRGRKAGEMKTRAAPTNREPEYKALTEQLEADNRMENKTAAARIIGIVVDAQRNLDTLREYDTKGTITAEERRTIAGFMKQITANLILLGLTDLEKKKSGFRS